MINIKLQMNGFRFNARFMTPTEFSSLPSRLASPWLSVFPSGVEVQAICLTSSLPEVKQDIPKLRSSLFSKRRFSLLCFKASKVP